MTLIGIDFSLNSPGLCIFKDNEYKFISFFNTDNREWDRIEKPYKGFIWHNYLNKENAIFPIPYYRKVHSKEFILREREKLEDSKCVTEIIMAEINSYNGEVKIGLEGFSYGSKGNSFIDIVGYNTILRSALLEKFGSENIFIFPPSQVKRLTGKGNANKHLMVKSFQNNVLEDSTLKETKLWNLINKKDFSKSIPKPIDDIIDSYFIVQCLIKSLNSSLN